MATVPVNFYASTVGRWPPSLLFGILLHDVEVSSLRRFDICGRLVSHKQYHNMAVAAASCVHANVQQQTALPFTQLPVSHAAAMRIVFLRRLG